MTAKQYLQQIRRLDLKINQRIAEAEDLRRRAFGLRSPELKADVVKTSPAGDPIGAAMSRYVDLQREIDELTDQLVDMKENE